MLDVALLLPAFLPIEASVIRSPLLVALLLFVVSSCAPAAEEPSSSLPASSSPAASGLFSDPGAVDPEFPPEMIELAIPFGEDRLNGIALTAAGEGPHPAVLLLHAFPGFEKNLDLAQALRRDGYTVVTFHYRGTWGSGGSFSWNRSLEDVAHVAQYMTDEAERFRIDPDRLALFGHSFGGILSLRAGVGTDQYRCVVSVAPEDWTQWIGSEEEQQTILNYLDGVHAVQGYPKEQALADLLADEDAWKLDTLVRLLGDKPVLLISGELDSAFDTPTRESYTAIAREAGATELTSLTIEGADHSFNARRIELIETVAGWMSGACR